LLIQCDANLDGVFDLNDGDQWAPLTSWAFYVLPSKQAPTIVPNDMLDITTVTAAPGEDPAPIDVVITYPNFGLCASTFEVDPPPCPSTNSVCQGVDLGAGFPIVPTGACWYSKWQSE